MNKKVKVREKLRQYHNAGMTMVEMMVVMIIMVILASAVSVGVIQWTKWSQFKFQNECAQMLFQVAQNQLTRYDESGQLPLIQQFLMEDAEYLHKVNISQLTSEDGNSYENMQSIFQNSKNKENPGRYQEDICYIIATAEDYKAYQTNQQVLPKEYKNLTTGMTSQELNFFYDTISPYVYDPSVLSASICMEFTAEDGQVFSVLYCNKQRQFSYSADSDTQINISNRQESYRKERMLGYYGVDTLSKATSRNLKKPVISDVQLVNEDTLHLRFRLSKVPIAINQLNYEIKVYDSENRKAQFSLILPGSEITNKESESDTHIIKDCQMVFYEYTTDAGTGVETVTTKTKTLNFYAWLDGETNNHDLAKTYVNLVLDGADKEATLDGSAKLNDTFSFYRLAFQDKADASYKNDIENIQPSQNGVKDKVIKEVEEILADNIYCSVRGSSDYYKTTALKNSNVEHAFFGSTAGNPETMKGSQITITNARHLYNMRYLEDLLEFIPEKRADYTLSYEMKQNITWSSSPYLTGRDAEQEGELGLWENKVLFAGQQQAQTNRFPKLSKLHECSKLTGKTLLGDNYSITGLHLIQTEEAIPLAVPDEADSGLNTANLGLFAINEGTIENISIDQSTVSGIDKVGTFCGENAGTLINLTVMNSEPDKLPASVTGQNYVGGVFGVQKNVDGNTNPIKLEKLINRASVSGTQNYIGGITGVLRANASQEITITKCENYGKIRAAEKDTKYIGGIVGYADNSNHANFMMEECNSSPYYSVAEIKALLSPTINADQLMGYYVGGIVGYNKGTQISKCQTRREKNNVGYLLGYQYVGGIVGFQENVGTNLNGETAGLRKRGENALNVIGASYVGGIAGCNAKISSTDTTTGIVSVSNEKDLTGLKISSWLNSGIILATEQYAGGIVGYNTGTIENSTCQVVERPDTISASQMQLADYAGGIAGYNNGVIQKTDDKVMDVVCDIGGKNFVGGIVGYNDVDAVVNDYMLAGGYVEASGAFAGGYVGFNASKALLESSSLKVSPNHVKGKYCVGGVIGGNIVSLTEDKQLPLMTNNFLGNMEGTAVVGGFIGYNQICNTKEKEDIYKGAVSLAQKLDTDDLVIIHDELENSSLENIASTYQFQIKGDGTNTTTAYLGELQARVYVGGVIGYNEKNSKLYVKDVENRTPVRATDSIAVKEQGESESDPVNKDYNGNPFQYSYAGGIIGKVGKNVTLDHCSNVEQGLVTSGPDATYTGGLCELNEGTIINCFASNLGNANIDYVGGITGLNKEDALMDSCVLSGITISGKNIVGGLAAENYGKIQNTVFEKKEGLETVIKSSGDKTGGITGINYATGKLCLSKDGATEASILELSVTSQGDYTGGVIGYNYGTVTPGTNAKGAIFEGAVYGRKDVGGFIGYDAGKGTIEKLLNKSNVTAQNGEAGGIVGEVAGAAQIIACGNTGTITAQRTGAAGGIVANNNHKDGSITYCGDYGQINSANGDCGGITCVNNGKIENARINCLFPTGDEMPWWSQDATVKSYVDKKENMVFAAKNRAGGICALNSEDGRISYIYVEHTDVDNTEKSKEKKSFVGAVAGLNQGEISIYGDKAIRDTRVITYVSDAFLGGVAGSNEGIISGHKDGSDECRVSVEIMMKGKADYATAGGVAGINSGTIKKCSVFADIEGNGGDDDNGYGGIAGVNGIRAEDGEIKINTTAVIEECSYDGKDSSTDSDRHGILVQSTADHIANVGGIAGKNYGRIIGSIVGKENDTLLTSGYQDLKKNTTTGYGYVGGMVGWNYGNIENSDNYIDSPKAVSIVNYAGHTGGIVGYQMPGAVITGTIESISNTEVSGATLVSTGEASKQYIVGKPVSTGANWVIRSKNYSNDCGCGGIIGYSGSGRDMTYVVNYAKVFTEKSEDNVTTAGIIGRMENREKTNTKLYYVINKGDIQAVAGITGGIVGRMKFNIARFDHCFNTGKVQNTGGANSVAGILASAYKCDGNSGNLTFVSCFNEGYISTNANRAAGIFARKEDILSKDYNVIFTDCVNVGVINTQNYATNESAGISSTDDNAHFYRCRNYGNGQGGTNQENSSFNGIARAYRELHSCFNISNSQLLSNTLGNEVNCYSLSRDERSIGDAVDMPKISNFQANDSTGAVMGVSDSIDAIFDSNQDNRAVYSVGNVDRMIGATLTFTFDHSANITGFGINWAGNQNTNGTQRTYTYRISGKKSNGDVKYLVEDSSNVYKWEDNVKNAKVFEEKSKNSGSEGYAKVSFSPENLSSISIEFTNKIVNTGDGAATTYVCFRGIQLKNGSSDWKSPQKTVIVDGSMAYVQKQDDGKYKIVDQSGVQLYKLFDLIIDSRESMNDFTQDNTEKRKPVYEEVDPKLMDGMRFNGDPTPPQSLVITNNGGVINMTWVNPDDKYETHKLVYTIKKDGTTIASGETSIPFGLNQYGMDMKSDWYGATLEVKLSSVNADKTKESAPINGSIILYRQETTPEMHVELADKYKYVVVWDNMDQYADGTVAIMKIDGKENKVTKQSGGKNYVTATGMPDDTKAIDISYLVKGDASRKTADSIIYSAQVDAYGTTGTTDTTGSLTQTDYIETKFDGFYGNLPGNMYYQVTMQPIGLNVETYVNSEFVLNNYSFKLPENEIYECNVAVSTGVSHVAKKTTSVVNKLQDLPDDFFTYTDKDNIKLTVQTYPIKSQGYMIWFGYTVKENISEAEMLSYMKDKSLTDTNRKDGKASVSVFGDTGLSEGYLLRKNQNGMYEVLYSPLFIKDADKLHYEKQVDQKIYTITADGKLTGQGSSADYYELQTAPELSDVMKTEGNRYTINWKAAGDNTNTSYNLKLTGLKQEDGEWDETLLMDTDAKTEEYKSDREGGYPWEHTFVNTESNWRYNQYLATVVRSGEVNSSNKTIKLPAVATKNYTVKLPLSQITAPVLTLKTNEAGIVEKDQLFYTLTWNRVPQEERDAVERYEITIVDEGKTDDLDEAKEEDKVIKFDQTKIAAAGDSIRLSTELDLNAYTGNHKLAISVKAIAKESSEFYRDGSEGVISEITLPVRLKVPNMSNAEGNINVIASPGYSTDSFVTQKDLEDGITISYQDSTASSLQGRYEMSASVYVNADDDQQIASQMDKESWQTDAKKVLKDSEDADAKDTFTMTGNLQEASYQLTDLADYAGMWLKIAMRAVSESQISSYWSYEDPDATVNSRWIQIPRMQINTPTLQSNGRVEVTNKDSSNENVLTGQTSLKFKESDYADAYKLQLIYEDRTENGKERDGAWIYVEKSGDDWKVFVYSTCDDEVTTSSDCVQDKRAKEVSIISTTVPGTNLPITQQIEASGKSMTTSMHISYKNGLFTLILPDVETIKGKGISYHCTERVLVQAVVLDEDNQKRYADSKISYYKYQKSGSGYNGSEAEYEKWTEKPGSVNTDVTVKGDKSSMILKESDGEHYVYHLKLTLVDTDNAPITDKDSKEIYQINSVKNGNSELEIKAAEVKALFGSGFEEENQIRVEIVDKAKITEQGISEWATDTTTGSGNLLKARRRIKYYILSVPEETQENLEEEIEKALEEDTLVEEEISKEEETLEEEIIKPSESEEPDETKPAEVETSEETKLADGKTPETTKPTEEETPEETKPTEDETPEETKSAEDRTEKETESVENKKTEEEKVEDPNSAKEEE